MIQKLLISFLCCLSWLTIPAQTLQTTFYVSPSGKADNPGTEQQPFASLQQARDAIRKNKAHFANASITVFLREGQYTFRKALVFSELDSGRLARPIRYAAYPGENVVFHGGLFLEPTQFKKVTNPDILKRLPTTAQRTILEINLRQLGLKDFGALKTHGFGRMPEPTPMELFIDGERQALARFPNKGKLDIGRVLDAGSIPREGDLFNRGAVFGYEYERPKRWLAADDIWLHGHFSFGFNDDNIQIKQIDTTEKTIALKQAHLYGVKSSLYVDSTKWIEMSGLSLRGYYAYNLLEEIDQAGEWFLDRNTGILYLYPPLNFEQARVEISIQQEPFFRLLNTAHLSFENIHFSTSRGMGVYLEKAHHISFQNCQFSKLGTVAISTGQMLEGYIQGYNLDGSLLLDYFHSKAFHHIAIRDCQISNTGTGGIILCGGNRQTLTSSHNEISHCTFSRVDQVNTTYSPAVKLFGVGNTISHCAFSDMKHMAIQFNGNDHRIEYNRFEQICTNADDMGAIYTGRDPSARGTVIQHNHFKDILPADEDSQVGAVFLDDGVGGIEVGHNYLERVGSQGDKELFGAVSIHGGHGNNIHHNVFQDCEVAIGNNYWKEPRWKTFLESALIQKRLFKTVDINSLPYQKRYPELKAYCTDFGPRLNRIAENILINSNMVLNGRGDFFYNHLEQAKNRDKALEKIGFNMDQVGPKH